MVVVVTLGEREVTCHRGHAILPVVAERVLGLSKLRLGGALMGQVAVGG